MVAPHPNEDCGRAGFLESGAERLTALQLRLYVGALFLVPDTGRVIADLRAVEYIPIEDDDGGPEFLRKRDERPLCGSEIFAPDMNVRPYEDRSVLYVDL